MKKWTKKIGDIHISGDNGRTLCGTPMLGNDYMSYYKKIDEERNLPPRKQCPKCWLEAQGLEE